MYVTFFFAGSCHADCSITLIKGKFKILVDTGGPKDSQVITKGRI